MQVRVPKNEQFQKIFAYKAHFLPDYDMQCLEFVTDSAVDK